MCMCTADVILKEALSSQLIYEYLSVGPGSNLRPPARLSGTNQLS